MTVLETIAVPNILYLSLMAGVWLAALAVVTPGTGVYEVLALMALVFTGYGALSVPINGWGLVILVLGGVMFGLSLRQARAQLWLALSAVTLSAGSALLFGVQGGVPQVHPVLAGVVSVLTVGLFWVAIRKAQDAQRLQPRHNPGAVVGKIGVVRTPLGPTGSVYVGGELWSARAETPIPVGARVRVLAREGLTLLVADVTGPSSS
jgi:membrane-bound serine protease (ClpP class)